MLFIERRDLLERLKSIKVEDNEEVFEYKLQTMIKNLERHILENKIELYSRVQVVDINEDEEGHQPLEFALEKGIVVGIDENWEYPYSIEWDNKELPNDYLFKGEQLIVL